METVKKKMLVAFKNRSRWQERINSVLQEIVGIVDLELCEEERAYLAAFPEAVTNMVYAGVLHSLVVEFGDEACEVELIYYPADEERDDLDLSLLEVIEWQVDEVKIRVLVEDLSYASSICRPPVQDFSSDRLSVSLEQDPASVAERDDDGDAEARIGNVNEGQEKEERKEAD